MRLRLLAGALALVGIAPAFAAEAPRTACPGVAIVLNLTVAPGAGPQFEALFDGMARKARREDGVRFYQLGRSRTEPLGYTIIEAYRDQAAFDRHRTAAYMKTALQAWGPLLAGKPSAQVLDACLPR
jgi:quinol monooxygenase YgiN